MAKTRKVILLLATERAHARGLLRGVIKYSRLHGPWVFYRDAPFFREPGALSRLKKWGANGIIAPDAKENKELIGMGISTIVYRMKREPTPGLPAVIADNARVGEMAAEHLLELGFRNFAYCGINGRPWSKERSESFSKRIEKAGFETCFFHRASRLHGPYSFETEQVRMVDWVKSVPKPVGLMAGNDDCGGLVLEACKIARLSVPDKVAVLGVDNDELICELTDPPLSSVAFNTEKAGYEVAWLLDRLMAGKEKMAGQRVAVHPTHIVSRQSTDILAIEDRDVVMAIRFIRQHAKEVIGVGDVVDTVTLSRRVLEKRFRKILRRSVYDEIKRCRIEQLTQMLVQTDLSVSQVALAFGFAGADKMCRYFRREKGISPMAYRKQYGTK